MLYIFHIYKKKGHPSLNHIILCIKQNSIQRHNRSSLCYCVALREQGNEHLDLLTNLISVDLLSLNDKAIVKAFLYKRQFLTFFQA